MLLWSFTVQYNILKVRNLHALVIIYRALLIFCTDKSNLSELGDVIIVVFNVKVRNLHALVIIYPAFNILYWQE